MEFIFHCILCAGPIPEDRVKRGGCTCSAPCQKEYRRRKRNLSARRRCRLCGRAFRRSRKSGAVLMPHSGILEVV